MHYFKLPTKQKQWLILIGTVVGYGLLFMAIDTSFSELSPNEKSKLSQGGLLLIFVAGALAGLPFSWAAKARHNLNNAESEMSLLKNQLEILNEQHQENSIDLSSSINSKKKALSIAATEKATASSFPGFLEHFGEVSLFVLALGTILCIVGAG